MVKYYIVNFRINLKRCHHYTTLYWMISMIISNYDDINVLPVILEDIRRLLRNHEAIDTNQTLMVNLLSFGPSSVDFWIYTFTKTTKWTEFHDIKESILFDIAGIIETHGAQIAYPTQTLHVDVAQPSMEPQERNSST